MMPKLRRRRCRVARHTLAALLLFGSVGTAAARGAAPPDIGGVYVIGQKFVLGNGILQKALAVPGVDGVLVDLRWAPDLASNMVRGEYDWGLLDRMTRLALARGKKFEIAIITGGSTPAWVVRAPPAGLGAASGDFDFIQADKPGATCLRETLAPPWDGRYLAAFGNLLDRLSAHLRQTGSYSALTMLRLTGVNTLTDELRLPAQTPENTGAYHCPIDNLAKWRALGYRPGLLAAGWRDMLALYRRAFPRKAFNVALITTNGLPAFRAGGIPVYTPVATAIGLSNATTSLLVDGAELALPGQIIVQSNGLVGDQPPDPTTIATAGAAGAMLAWQTNEWELQTGGAACAGTREHPVACTASSFYRMLKSGIYPDGAAEPDPLKAQYLELFAPNVLAFPNVVLRAHDLLMN